MPRSCIPQHALLSLALATAAVLQTPAQPPVQIQVPPLQQRAQVITLHAESRAVLLDVVVTDGRGHAIHGLQSSDFRIIEDGATQSVASFEEHHANTPDASHAVPPPPPLPPNTFTNRKPPINGRTATTVFLLDAIDSSPAAQSYARDQILSWIKEKPADAEVAIFQFGVQMRLIQGFTADQATLRNAVVTRYKPMLTAIPGGGYVAQASKMDFLTAAMQSLGAYLATRPGRKNLIWFTAHIPRAVYDGGSSVGGALHDGEGFVFDYSKATEALSLGEVSIYPIDTRGLETDPAFSAASSRRPPRNGGGFGTQQFLEHSDLEAVAEATGGRAFYNTNGIKQVISEVIDSGSNYYTLSYYPANKDWDGGYRKLKVEAMQSGVQLEYRRGYYAVAQAPPRDRTAPSPPTSNPPDAYGRVQLTHTGSTPDQAAFLHAMHLAAIDPNQIVFTARVDVNPTVDKIGKNQPLPKDNFLEPKYKDHPFRVFQVFSRFSADQFQLTQQPDGIYKGSIESAVFVLDDQGAVVNSIIDVIDLHLSPDNYTKAIAGGVELLSPIAVPEKGNYFLRVGIHDKSSGRAGALEFSTSDVKIGAPTP